MESSAVRLLANGDWIVNCRRSGLTTPRRLNFPTMWRKLGNSTTTRTTFRLELQEVAWIVSRPARPFGVHAPEAGSLQVEAIDECVDESNRIIEANISLPPLPEEAESENGPHLV